MTVNLIPQDELTLNLLAEVLAKMYQHSLNNKHDALAEVAEPGAGTSSADLENRRLSQVTPERDLTQVEKV
jgi:UDP-N-acetylglucosamine:LPS N-acetylglucosamine transferase